MHSLNGVCLLRPRGASLGLHIQSQERALKTLLWSSLNLPSSCGGLRPARDPKAHRAHRPPVRVSQVRPEPSCPTAEPWGRQTATLASGPQQRSRASWSRAITPTKLSTEAQARGRRYRIILSRRAGLGLTQEASRPAGFRQELRPGAKTP